MSDFPVPPPSTAGDVDHRCRAAVRAAPALAALPPADRAVLLDRLAATLRAHEQEIVTLADAETSLGRTRLTGELHRTAGQLELFAAALRDGGVLDVIIDAPDPAAVPAPRPGLRRWLVPLGPVAVFSASNFPLAFSVLGGDTASALAAGCPVVVKAHSGHPKLSDLVAGLAARVLPPGRARRRPRPAGGGPGWSPTPASPRWDSPAPWPAAGRCSTSPRRGPTPSRSTASSARSTRWS
ncbi:hypothetical protein GCM10020358_53500 [Amorphoplanes nipponensis]|uniref:aldehyde dehydrogenase family protein n=1 Tax=Actinoplanes nipponensis TaxID=135950 RepID=UPI0031ECD712